uniref:RNA methyltransferase n=1 Tax=Flavobacterium sp. TaxID=239 RepID=UPI00404786AC
VNEEIIKEDRVNNLVVQQPNTKFLNYPFGLLLYNSAKPNPDSTYQAWLTKKPNRIKRLNKFLSAKQVKRLGDWFGIETLFCSEESVDIYNPKVVQATMGSISRVNVVYGSLEAFLTKTKLPIFGTFMDGSNIYQEALPKEGFIVMGNEANGISPSVEKLVSERIAIPRFGNIQLTESLNVATATAIILSEFKRN